MVEQQANPPPYRMDEAIGDRASHGNRALTKGAPTFLLATLDGADHAHVDNFFVFSAASSRAVLTIFSNPEKFPVSAN